MASHNVFVFKPFLFESGQKIRIEDGPRKGDWEVIGLTEHKMKLRCPVTSREVEWNRFCYYVEERKDSPWPRVD